jgi:hypothetical protein
MDFCQSIYDWRTHYMLGCLIIILLAEKMGFLLRCGFYFRNIFEIPAGNLSDRVLNSFQRPVDVKNQKKSNRNGKDNLISNTYSHVLHLY